MDGSNRGGRLALAAALGAGLAAGDAAAQHGHGSGGGAKNSYPHIDGELELRVQPDWNYSSSFPNNRNVQLNGEVEALFGLHVTPEILIQTHLKWERVKVFEGRGDVSFFGGNGAFLQEFYGQYARDSWGVKLGKFTFDSFGRAWAEHPGLYANGFTEDYWLQENVGALAWWSFLDDVDFGKAKLTGSWFFTDNTALTNSILARPSIGSFLTERPGRTRYQDGGAGNTQWPASFMASVEGGAPDMLPGLTYNLGYMYLKHGSTEDTGRGNSENWTVASLAYEFELAKDLRIKPLVEWARLRGVDLDGTDLAGNAVFGDTDYVTGQIQLRYGGWTALASTTYRNNSQPSDAGPSDRDKLFALSLEYQFEFGLTLGVGWAYTKAPIDADPDGAVGITRTLGAIAWYVVEF